MVQYLDMYFDWDLEKAAINEVKHGVSFLQAMTAFDDDHALYINDGAHSEDEERLVLLGMSNEANLLMVCHCYRGNDDVIRLISARTANNREEKMYRR
ncbi:MAG: BrnT family toxin [Defluviitaleaceae bacterium]|nr:BrnT family toxin [Defluviitaleaceae bacterium]MCL2273332.1 BrnT family toxin [Defluviitaleaceae bacterium]